MTIILFKVLILFGLIRLFVRLVRCPQSDWLDMVALGGSISAVMITVIEAMPL